MEAIFEVFWGNLFNFIKNGLLNGRSILNGQLYLLNQKWICEGFQLPVTIEVVEKESALLNLVLEKLVCFSEVTDVTGGKQSLHEFLENEKGLVVAEDVESSLNGSFERGTEDEVYLFPL